MASNCPSCASPLAFRPGTMVSVCKACGSLCARTDRDPQLIGKVAALLETGSPLAVGATGRFAGRAFSVAGRIQMAHPLGGVWDEWYLALEDGRWGWLAEAQGRFLLTFPTATKAPVPAYEALQPGQQVDLGEQGRFAIQEASEARVAGAEGEIPWRVSLQESFRFADLGGPNGAFATLDYSEQPPLLYLGRDVPFADLHLHGVDAPPPAATRRDLALNCPNCAGPLKLRAPDETARVACPSCNALLDCAGGKLTFLHSLKQPHPNMRIPLGQEGTLRGRKVVCAGHMVRSCSVDGVDYPWGEYLLLTKAHGHLWLVESEGHWSLAEAIGIGDAPTAGSAQSRSFTWKDGSYRRFQDVTAAVRGVWGEFPWKVELGEQADIAEWVSAPTSLSLEVQKHKGGGSEANWTLSTYLEPSEIQAAFGLKDPLPSPRGVGSFQPNPHKGRLREIGTWMAVALAGLLGLLMVQSLTHKNALVWGQELNLEEAFPQLKRPGMPPAPGTGRASRAPSLPAAPSPEGQEPVLVVGPLDIKEGRKNLAFTLASPVNNQWIGIEGALINEQTGLVEAFEVASSYYHGVDDGESWSEGKQKETVYLSALPEGRYMLRLAPQWDGPTPPVRTIRMELRSGVMHLPYIGLALLAILLGPAILLFKVMAFEGRRWQESMYGTSSSDSSGSDD
ncbi:MAG: DUF4178 domain-containing protein [Acidobacteria bacterium]|nr:DUF4178 domain-containing protein [Acidobacteriota bacterium]